MNETYEERARREKLPISYCIYKGIKGSNGVLRVKLNGPYNEKSEEGNIFLETAKAIDKNVYDWKNKITISLKITDIGKLVTFMEYYQHPMFLQDDRSFALNIFHKTNNESKIFQLRKEKDKINYTATTTHLQNGQEVQKVFLPVSPDELIILRELFKSSIPKLLSW